MLKMMTFVLYMSHKRTYLKASEDVYQQHHLCLSMMGEHKRPLKVYDKDIYSQLPHFKYKVQLPILYIGGK